MRRSSAKRTRHRGEPGAGGCCRLVHPPAVAPHGVMVMRDHLRGHQWDLDLLVRGNHPEVPGVG